MLRRISQVLGLGSSSRAPEPQQPADAKERASVPRRVTAADVDRGPLRAVLQTKEQVYAGEASVFQDFVFPEGLAVGRPVRSLGRSSYGESQGAGFWRGSETSWKAEGTVAALDGLVATFEWREATSQTDYGPLPPAQVPAKADLSLYWNPAPLAETSQSSCCGQWWNFRRRGPGFRVPSPERDKFAFTVLSCEPVPGSESVVEIRAAAPTGEEATVRIDSRKSAAVLGYCLRDAVLGDGAQRAFVVRCADGRELQAQEPISKLLPLEPWESL